MQKATQKHERTESDTSDIETQNDASSFYMDMEDIAETGECPEVEFVRDLRMRGHVCVHDSDSDHDAHAETSPANDTQDDNAKCNTVDSLNTTCDSRDVAGGTRDKVVTQHDTVSSSRGADDTVRATADSTPDNKSITSAFSSSCDTKTNGCNGDVKSRDTANDDADTLGYTARNPHGTRNDTPANDRDEISTDHAKDEQDTIGPRSPSAPRGALCSPSAHPSAHPSPPRTRLGAHHKKQWTPKCTHLVRTRTRMVSLRQLDILWEFLNSNREIATSFNRTFRAKELSQRMWKKIAVILNSQDGVRKDWRGWSKYWVDYKAKLRARFAALQSSQQQIGGKPSIDQAMAEFDEKFLQILGHNVRRELPHIRVKPIVEPQDTEIPEESLDVMDAQDIPSVNTSVRDIPSLNTCMAPALSTSADVHRPSAPAHSPAAPHCSPRRHRRREPAMSQEAARRALVHSAQLRADAAVRTSEALLRMAHSLEQIKNSTERIERVLNFVLPKVAELENGE